MPISQKVKKHHSNIIIINSDIQVQDHLPSAQSKKTSIMAHQTPCNLQLSVCTVIWKCRGTLQYQTFSRAKSKSPPAYIVEWAVAAVLDKKDTVTVHLAVTMNALEWLAVNEWFCQEGVINVKRPQG
jgi:hypothetical protein